MVMLSMSREILRHNWSKSQCAQVQPVTCRDLWFPFNNVRCVPQIPLERWVIFHELNIIQLHGYVPFYNMGLHSCTFMGRNL